jgi:hypothetical protein
LRQGVEVEFLGKQTGEGEPSWADKALLRVTRDRKGWAWEAGFWKASVWKSGLLLALSASLLAVESPLLAREKDTAPYGEGLIMNVPFPEHEVAQVVQDTVQNGIIRGTKEYNKDEFVSGAVPQPAVKLFRPWTGGGEVFYKVKVHALDPRNFKDSGDMGTLAVRYIVQAQGEKNTVVHIDAVFVEDIRRTTHLSNGSVESAEFKDIHDRLDQIALMNSETAEIAREQAEKRNPTKSSPVSSSRDASAGQPSSLAPSTLPPSASQPSTSQPISRATALASSPGPGNAPAQASATPAETAMNPEGGAPVMRYSGSDGVPQSAEERVQELRRQVERQVKAPGGALRSAPFHTASTLQSLPAGTEVLIVVSTPYWFGIETHEGQHGWMLRDDLELVP